MTPLRCQKVNSDQFNENAAGKTAKTLLLCRINPAHNQPESQFTNYQDQYNTCYCGEKDSNGSRYISLGNIDMFCLYDTVPNERISNPDWFSDLYQDRKKIIWETSPYKCYHPIHLVANQVYNSKAKATTPFCVVTLIYGINTDQRKENDSNRLSTFEREIASFLSQQSVIEDYEIYNAVNLCDAVIVWHTSDISSPLVNSEQLVKGKVARKTYTIIGLAWDNKTGFVTDDVIRYLQNSSSLPFSFRVQGSIKDQSLFIKLLGELFGKRDSINGEKCNVPAINYKKFIVSGQNDFIIIIQQLSALQLLGLLDYYINGSTEKSGSGQNKDLISDACWDIHTDFMFENESSVSSIAKKETPSEYAVTKMGERFALLGLAKLQEYPWLAPYYELLNVLTNIERHPILQGPDSLFLNCLCITYYYLNLLIHGSDAEKKKMQIVLQASESLVNEVIRVWGVLTDQMLRVDDFIYRGLGNSSVLYNTLPECAIVFYHRYLQQFINALLDLDFADGRIRQEDREECMFDFLLLPEMDSKISIQPMFHNELLGVFSGASKRLFGPQKQVFTVYFPIETVYSPINFFAPLLHECFHYFCDACRLRAERKIFFCDALSKLIVSSVSGYWDVSGLVSASNGTGLSSIIKDKLIELVGFSEPNETDLLDRLSISRVDDAFSKEDIEEKLCKELAAQITTAWKYEIGTVLGARICESVFKSLVTVLKTGGRTGNRYLDLGILLETGVQSVFSENGRDNIVFVLRGNELDAFEKVWSESKREKGIECSPVLPAIFTDWSLVLEDYLLFLFKECYADLMMLLLLPLDENQYLSLFQNELRYERDFGRPAQRLALVLSVLTEKQRFQMNTINTYVDSCIRNNPDIAEFYECLRAIYVGLIDLDQPLDTQERDFVFPLPVLNTIKQYLLRVHETFNSMRTKSMNAEGNNQIKDIFKNVDSLKNDFNSIFLNGEFLSNGYFQIIDKGLSISDHAKPLGGDSIQG